MQWIIYSIRLWFLKILVFNYFEIWLLHIVLYSYLFKVCYLWYKYSSNNLLMFLKSGLSTDGDIDKVLLVGPKAPAT